MPVRRSDVLATTSERGPELSVVLAAGATFQQLAITTHPRSLQI